MIEYWNKNLCINNKWKLDISSFVSKLDMEAIKKFCADVYGRDCNRFRTFCDWETYWIIDFIKIPVSTVYNWLGNKTTKWVLKVDSNNTLQFWIIYRNKFKKQW